MIFAQCLPAGVFAKVFSFLQHCTSSVAQCFSWAMLASKSVRPLLAFGSNCAVKPTRLRRAAYFRSLGPPYSRFMQARIYSSASPFSSVFPLGFWPCGGLRLGLVRFFKPFRPLALAQQALVAIILQVLRRFRGAALFRSVRPSSTWGFPFWPMGLTVQSSRPAFCGRLTFGR